MIPKCVTCHAHADEEEPSRQQEVKCRGAMWTSKRLPAAECESECSLCRKDTNQAQNYFGSQASTGPRLLPMIINPTPVSSAMANRAANAVTCFGFSDVVNFLEVI